MAVTRIKNNQITDATIDASAKLVDYSITAGKIANNLSYGSNLTVTGNLTVQGTTATVDAVKTVIDDPLILLARNQSSSGAVDIGFIGERGSDTNIGFIFDESADEFAAVFTSDADSNTTLTITDYADVHSGGLTVDDNGTVGGTLDVTGNLSGGNISTVGQVEATANITGGNLITGGLVSVTGNITGGNLVTAGAITDGTLTISSGNITGADTASFSGSVTATGNIDGGNIISQADVTTATVTASSTIDATGNITGGNLITSAAVESATITTSGSGTIGGSLTVSGNLTVSGTTTTVNSTVTTVADPIMTFGQNATDDNKDRGIEFKYNDGSAKVGFFGYDDSTGAFTALTGATNSSEVFSGTAAPATFGAITGTTGTFTSNATVGGTFGVTGETTLASAIVSDLTDNRIVIAGSSGALEDDTNLTFDGSTFEVGGGYGSTGADIATNGNFSTNGTVTVDGLSSLDGGIDVNSTNFAVATSGRVTTVEDIAIAVDSKNLEIGASADFTITHNGTDTKLTNNTGILAIDGAASSSIRVNEAGNDVDFVVEGSTDTALLHIDAGADEIVIGSSTTTTGAKLKIASSDSMLLPVGNTGQRPGTGAAGMLRYNTTVSNMEFYDGSEWQTAGTTFTVIASETFNGDGSTVAFTLSDAQTTASCIVSINGVLQIPTTAYGVSSTTLTFTEAPISGDVIEVRKLTTTQSIVGIANSGGEASLEAIDGEANFTLTGNIIPSSNNVYTLGNASSYFSDAYIGPGSLYVNGQKVLEDDSGTIIVQADQDQGITVKTTGTGTTTVQSAAGTTISASGTADVTLQTDAGGQIEVNGNLVINSTKTVLSSDSSAITIDADVDFNSNDLSSVATLTTSGDVTVGGDATVTGNLTVSGTTTTVSSTNTTVTDALMELNNGAASNANDLGIVMERGSTGDNAFMGWDESADSFVLGTTTATGSSSGDLTITAAPLSISSLTLGGTAITSTAAELNILDGVTATAAELNIMDGVTATTTELNYVDGVTSSIQTQLDGKLTAGATSGSGISGSASSGTFTVTSNATSANTASTIVFRDASGNFSAGTITGTATAAQYADLAENYLADAEYQPGTVVCFGGDAEVTVCDHEDDTRVAGVITTNPAHLMNSSLEGDYVAGVALTGRVPCKVTGPVAKGDLMVSAGNGTAKANNSPAIGSVIGKALENFDGEEGTIEVVVGRF